MLPQAPGRDEARVNQLKRGEEACSPTDWAGDLPLVTLSYRDMKGCQCPMSV